jgi:hypothetical protein
MDSVGVLSRAARASGVVDRNVASSHVAAVPKLASLILDQKKKRPVRWPKKDNVDAAMLHALRPLQNPKPASRKLLLKRLPIVRSPAVCSVRSVHLIKTHVFRFLLLLELLCHKIVY